MRRTRLRLAAWTLWRSSLFTTCTSGLGRRCPAGVRVWLAKMTRRPAPVPPPVGPDGLYRESRERSIVKGLTWRTLASSITAVAAWAVSGHTAHAAEIVTYEVPSKLALYYLHERAWQMAPRGYIRKRLGAEATPQAAGVTRAARGGGPNPAAGVNDGGAAGRVRKSDVNA